MDSTVWAAFELVALVAIGATLTGLLVGYAWGRKAAGNKELITEEDIPQLFPASDPLEWDHLSVETERQQAL